jgi:pterin-4a-carbinolamine dehydratase
MPLLDDDEIAERLRGSAWRREGDEIVRDLKFADFAEAMRFVNAVADAAEPRTTIPTSSCTAGTGSGRRSRTTPRAA